MESSDCSVTVVRDRAALGAFTAEWEDLAANALEANPVYEAWMLLPALEEFAAGQDLRVVMVRYRNELAGVFPLQYERRYKGLPAPTLTSWRHPHCRLCVPLVRASCAAQVLKGFVEWMRGSGASIVELSYLPAEGAFHQRLVDALNDGDHASLVTNAYTRPLLCRGTDADTYLNSSLSGELRRDLRRREKRLREMGVVEHVALRSRDELGRWIEDFLALEASGWKGRRGSALACSESNRRFAVEVFTRAFERGRLAMVGVNLNGKPIARHCSLLAGEGAISFKTAYDEDARRFAPGILAEVDSIRAFHERSGVQWMDSYTAPNNEFIANLWKHRRTIQRVAVAANARGELVLSLVPLMRWAKRRLKSLRGATRSDQGAAQPVFRPS